MLLELEHSQLVLIDFQTKLMPAMRDHLSVVHQAANLARMAALLGVPVVYTEQNPTKLGTTTAELLSALTPVSVKHLAKMHFSAVQDGLVDILRPPAKAVQGNARSLPKHLQKPPPVQADSIVLAGCEAHVCLLQTALDLLDEGFEVWIVTDACSSRTERNRDAAFDRLAGAGVELVTTEMVAFEWLRSSEHPAFKDIQSLIK